MQVKKFEARSMKEALEMVKSQLGPDAIILGVKDNKRSFGLIGEVSIEITAAVSEETLQKKKFAESRLRDQERVKLMSRPAKVQKEYYNKVADNYTRDNEVLKPITKTKYIEIADEVDGLRLQPEPAAERIRSAAQRAWNVMQSQDEIHTLKSEIVGLRNVIKKFQSVPQTISGNNHRAAYPGADFDLRYEVSPMFEKLTQAGVSPEIAAEILVLAQNQMPAIKIKNKALVDAWVAKYILDSTKIVNEKKPSKIQVFVGPSGAGKTSTLVKLASSFVVNDKKKIALVTADTLKVGAAEQLKIYAQILNVPFAIIRQASDWQSMIGQLNHFDHVLVDCPGLTLKSIEENSFLRNTFPPSAAQTSVHLVLEATAKDQDITEIGRRYKGYGFQDVIFTNLDQSVQHGSIFNFMKRFDVPLHSFGIGPRVPEDYEMATKERMLDLLFKLTSLKKM